MTQSPSFEKHLAEDRRLALLRVLADSTGYQTNEYTLEAVLEDLGHHVSNARLRADLTWLSESELITTSTAGGVTIATLTQRGLDAARGKMTVPGVKRPRPESWRQP